MRWSKKVAWTVGTSIWGMWQETQLDSRTGQVAIARVCGDWDLVGVVGDWVWQLRHLAS